MAEKQDTRQLVVIGAGPAGYPAAFHAADLGLQVTLIDPEAAPGGVCLYRGCIPSKALLHVAALLNETREASAMGVSFQEPAIDRAKLKAWKDAVVSRLTGGLGALCKQRHITLLRGRAVFTDAHTIRVERTDGAAQDIAFEHAIVAAGARPAAIPVAPDSPRVLDSTGALALEDIPDRLLVIGGGYIGLELGQVYAALGAQVSVVEMLPGLLPGADRDLAGLLARRVKQQFESVMLNTRVTAMRETGDGIVVKSAAEDGTESEQTFDRVLVAVGRRANTETLGLDKAGVRVGEDGFVEVDGQRRTSSPRIFAVGDVAGQPMLAHKATAEAKVAVAAILGRKTVFEPAAIPAVVFTDPELAWCGLTEEEAQRQGREVETASFPWAASGRAMTLGRTDGLTKIVAEPGSRRVLGVGIAGHGAGELIAEGVLAVEMGAVAEDLALTIHPHPTLSETLMEAAEAFEGRSTHFVKRKK